MDDIKTEYYLSLDVSTTNVGIALWDKETGTLLELKHLSLKINRKDVDPEYRDLIKSDLFEEYFIEYKKYVESELDGVISKVIIEAPLPNTKVNINTTALLLGFNGMARRILYQIFETKPIKLSVHDSRKNFLPEFVKRKKKRDGSIETTLSFPKGWKANEKKRFIWEKVSKLEPEIEWFYKKNSDEPKDICFDMSDAYCVGYAQLKIDEIIQ
jgi:hypothetical protein